MILNCMLNWRKQQVWLKRNQLRPSSWRRKSTISLRKEFIKRVQIQVKIQDQMITTRVTTKVLGPKRSWRLRRSTRRSSKKSWILWLRELTINQVPEVALVMRNTSNIKWTILRRENTKISWRVWNIIFCRIRHSWELLSISQKGDTSSNQIKAPQVHRLLKTRRRGITKTS
jgi:hypothetical protein